MDIYFMTLRARQIEAFDLVRAGKTVFITGPGGCGKTYLIKYIKEQLDGIMSNNILDITTSAMIPTQPTSTSTTSLTTSLTPTSITSIATSISTATTVGTNKRNNKTNKRPNKTNTEIITTEIKIIDTVAVTALTGIAACLIGGQTLHSWAGMSGNDKISKETMLTIIMKNPDAVARWTQTRILIIDEVSMLSVELLNKLHYYGQQIRGNNKFFGGLQVIFSGDFCQLPPVGIVDRYCFESIIWIENVKHIVYLNEIMRQKNPILQHILNEIRIGILTPKTKQILNSRLISEKNPLPDTSGLTAVKPTILYPYNKNVDELNDQALLELIGTEETPLFSDASIPNNICTIDTTIITTAAAAVIPIPIKAIASKNKQIPYCFTSKDVFKDWKNIDRKLKTTEIKEINILLDNGCPGLRQITYCIGAQVMLIVNLDFDKGLVNGTRGVVIKFVPIKNRSKTEISISSPPNNGESKNINKNKIRESDVLSNHFDFAPVVKFMIGPNVYIEKTIMPHIWQLDHPKYTITRQQFPLIHAWAMSIHKAQGQSCSLVITDLKNVFSPGQAYVALSRIQTLEGLFLEGIAYSKITCHPKIKKFYSQLK